MCPRDYNICGQSTCINMIQNLENILLKYTKIVRYVNKLAYLTLYFYAYCLTDQ